MTKFLSSRVLKECQSSRHIREIIPLSKGFCIMGSLKRLFVNTQRFFKGHMRDKFWVKWRLNFLLWKIFGICWWYIADSVISYLHAGTYVMSSYWERLLQLPVIYNSNALATFLLWEEFLERKFNSCVFFFSPLSVFILYLKKNQIFLTFNYHFS